MKKYILPILLLGLPLSGAFGAASFTPNAGYQSSALFSTDLNFNITGLTSDSSGNVYYLENDGVFSSSATSTRLLKRSSSDGYTAVTELYDLGTASGGFPIFGSFVKLQGSTLYFGESSNGTISSIGINGTGFTPIATVTGNYDLTFSGADAFVSHYDGSTNLVSELNLGTGTLTTAVDTDGDFSGPIAFDDSGNLLYGATTFGSITDGGLYRFDAADVATALAGTPITITPPTDRILENGSNGAFERAPGNLLYLRDGNGVALNLLNLDTLSSESLGSMAVGSLGALSFDNDTLYASATDYTANQSTVFAIIPEPGTPLLLLVGFGGAALLRRRSSRNLQ